MLLPLRGENGMNKRLAKNVPQTIGGVLALITFREMFANYGYEEGMKRILAKQIQQTLEREKQPNPVPAVVQSSSQ